MDGVICCNPTKSATILSDIDDKSFFSVGLQHAVPPINTKFKPILHPTQAGIPYTNAHKLRISYFKSTLTFLGQLSAGSSFLPTNKNGTVRYIRMYI